VTSPGPGWPMGDVVDTLANHPGLDHTPGEQFRYSNSNYVLLAELILRTTGRTLREVILEEFGAAMGLPSLWIDDGDEAAPDGTAEGYSPEDSGFRQSSYETIDLAGPAPIVHLRNATTGAGGAFISAVDLAKWGESQLAVLARAAVRNPVPIEETDLGALVGSLAGHQNGWFVSDLAGRTVYWHDGNRGGLRGCACRGARRGADGRVPREPV
jgi:CubicO group peptidase (beta-lactamase class C family)